VTIGITISNLLKNHHGLAALVPTGNIFAYIANENTPLPLVIYTVDSLSPGYDKDGWVKDDCDFSVVSFSEDYSELQDIATEIRDAFECVYTSGTDRFTMSGQQEGYNINEGVFLNKLMFNVEIKDY
jgi:hypothetical protein